MASGGPSSTRQFVFTVPKRLRLYFRYDRSLLGALCQAAWRTVCTVCQATNGRPDGVPGMVGAIQTVGDLIHFHPHIHALVSQGQKRGARIGCSETMRAA